MTTLVRMAYMFMALSVRLRPHDVLASNHLLIQAIGCLYFAAIDFQRRFSV